MRTRLATFLLIALNVGIVLGADGPPKPPELKLLERFVGTWDCDVVVKPAAWTPQEVREKSAEVNELTLDGWFLRGTSKKPDGRTQASLMNTYDPVQKKYRTWRFGADGACEEMTGQWDEATATLTLSRDLGNGVTGRLAIHLIDKDRREFRVLAKDGDGKVYMDVQGTVTRRK